MSIYITYLPSFGENCCPISNVHVASDDRCNSFLQDVGPFLQYYTASHTFHSTCLSACPPSQTKVSYPRVRRKKENEQPALFIYLYFWLFNDAAISSEYILRLTVGWFIHSELGREWKEPDLSYYRAVFLEGWKKRRETLVTWPRGWSRNILNTK
jgi:hypothetical protein